MSAEKLKWPSPGRHTVHFVNCAILGAYVMFVFHQVSGRGKRSLETKLLKVYVKLLARLLRDSEKDNFGTNDQGSSNE